MQQGISDAVWGLRVGTAGKYLKHYVGCGVQQGTFQALWPPSPTPTHHPPIFDYK